MGNEELAIKLKELEVRMQNIDKRTADLEDFQKAQDKLIITVHELAINMGNMLEELKDQSKRLKDLEDAPLNEIRERKKSFIDGFLRGISTILATAFISLIVYAISTM